MIKHLFIAVITVIAYIIYLFYYLIWDFSKPFLSFSDMRREVYDWWEQDKSDDYYDGWGY